MRNVTCSVAPLILLLTLTASPATAATRRPAASDAFAPRSLGALVDSIITARMKQEGIPGAGFVFVRHGRVVYQRGYGFANVRERRRVDPERTIWRIGSITKTFTATAVMQLVDRGSVHLEADVNHYLSKVKVPDTYPLPVTVRDLLTHTSGLDEIRPGTQAPSRDSVLSLPDFLRPRLVRVRPPGETITYSTYGITVAGEVVEEVSGQPIEQYFAENIWGPLGMKRTSITVPPSLSGDLAMGYERGGDSLQPQPWEWYHTTPASSINSTVSDMARYLLAHLEKGRYAGTTLLSERAAASMLDTQVRMHPKVPGVTLGFWENQFGKLRVVEHGGNMAGFSAQMVMIPEDEAGFFVVCQLEGSGLRDNLEAVLIHALYPASLQYPPAPKPPPDFRKRGDAYAGTYAWMTGCHSCNPRTVSVVQEVKIEGDALRLGNFRYTEVAPLLFLREDRNAYLAFRQDSSGKIMEMYPGSFWSFERLPNP